MSSRINPVTGRWEPEKRDPMEGMTDEQKEYEAEKLIDAIDKLQRLVGLLVMTRVNLA